MSLVQKYRKSQKAPWCLRLKTKHPDGDHYDGVITDIKRSFIILREQIDFEFNDLFVLTKQAISGYRDGAIEKCCNEILKKNGAIKKARSPGWLNSCGTLRDIVAELDRRGIWPGVEILFNDGSDSAYYIGPITRVASNTFFMRGYDSAGRWEKEYEISYDEIIRIVIESKYSTYFNAYMKSKESG